MIPGVRSVGPEVFDAIVIGGGPAGVTCAHQLAMRGRSVLLLEKERHPRFRVGESLMPYVTAVLDSIGILQDVEERGGPFVVKRSVEVSDSEGGYFRTYFSSLAEGQRKYGFNVERAPFDTVLCQHAERAGVRVLQQARVTALVFEGDRVVGVTYEHDEEERVARAPFVADASGRAGVAARQLRSRRMNRRLAKVAVFQYFCDTVPGVNASDEGDLVVATHEDGWIWCIPVGPGARSVGAVMAAQALGGRERQEVFDRHLRRAPRINDSLEGASPLFDALMVESDFCYHAEQLAGPGYFLVGDAGCFVDPVFSGGVFLGMVSGMKAAEVIDEIIGGKDEREAAHHFENFAKTGYDHYFRLVYAFYEGCGGNIGRLFRDMFPGRFKHLLQVLAGDLWSYEANPIWSELRARSEWDTFEQPFEPVYGCPVYPETSLAMEEAARDQGV
ncbi:MAG: FAD-dependent oxidoreductase [Actinomycetota bacterium]|nr:FAD-dependent oxidoreductase [Actinomycetota bacterium]